MAFSSRARRLLAAGGLGIAVVTPVMAALSGAPSPMPTPLATCPAGEHADEFTTTCVPMLVPNSPAKPVTATTPTDDDLCPPGVGGAECTTEAPSPAQPQGTAPIVGSPEQQLEDVSTPDY